MITDHSCIAIPLGHTPPTELPGKYQCIVYAFEIIDSHQAGFVYLRISHVLTKQDNGFYVAEKIEENNETTFYEMTLFVNNTASEIQSANYFPLFANIEIQKSPFAQSILTPAVVTHGPANTSPVHNEILHAALKSTHLRTSHLTLDAVPCMRCLLWPTLAANWPTRYRNHGWPEQRTIHSVVINGCDLVGAVHPLCRQDKLMNEHQWRLSFSRAEVTLLNSWTKVQQIVYHMLRYILKREVLSKTDDQEQDLPKLSNYHIKTLMLWECEQKPQSWWSAESSLIKLCSSLLHKLSDWVEDKRCQHYFISSCNILDHFVEEASTAICNSLRSLADESILLTWFTENYIRRCALYCPDDVSVLFEDISSSDKLQRAVDAVVDWKSNTLTRDICTDYYDTEKVIIGYRLIFRTDAKFIQALMKELQNFDLRLRDYFAALTSLQVAYTIWMNSLTEDLLEILWILFEPCTDVADGIGKSYCGELLCIQRAIKLATLTTDRSNALETLHNELSKAYLHHSFAYGQESTYCVVHVLLAALYYKSGHYQTAIDHCKQVVNQSDCGSVCIGAEYLPQIDESVDAVFGLVLLY